MEAETVNWAAAELAGADLGDARLNRRLVRVAERLGAQPGASIPVACGGWAETQAAYRLLAHKNVDWESVLAPHWDGSVERMRAHRVVLCVQDTTELDFTSQPGIEGLGPLSYLRQHGLYVHPTLAVTPDGVPLGVLDAWLWARDRETFGDDKRHWPIEAKESMRWLEGFERCAELAATLPDTRLVYVADRECDIHEFMVRAGRWPDVDWLIRATHNRCLAEGDKLWERLAKGAVLGEVTFTLPARPGRPSRPVVLTVRAERVTLHPKGGEPVTVTALRAREESPPADVRAARLAAAHQPPGRHPRPSGRVAPMVWQVVGASKSTSHTTSVTLKIEMETYFLVVAGVGTLHAGGAGVRVQPRRRGPTKEDGSHCRLAGPGTGRGVANCATLGAGYRAPPPTRRASIRRPHARSEPPASVATTAVLGAAAGHPPSRR